MKHIVRLDRDGDTHIRRFAVHRVLELAEFSSEMLNNTL